MTRAEALKELKAMGTAQNRKVYARHGVDGAMYGVSYANLGKLKKKIKQDQDLAGQLWETGNHDARILATMVADPQRITAAQLDRWARSLDNQVQAAALSNLAAASGSAVKRVEKWTAARGEWIGTAGYGAMASLAMADNDLPDSYFADHLAIIQRTIHQRQNRVRYAMNNTLIAIGTRSARLEKQALAAARRIGKVKVDHGETGCKTPDALAYIPKAAAHRRRKKRG